MIPAVTTDNKNITEQIAFIHHAITEQSHNVHSTTRLITAAIVAEIRIFVFVFISFIFFCLFQKKAARVGYANIISSLSLRLAAVPLWFQIRRVVIVRFWLFTLTIYSTFCSSVLVVEHTCEQ